MDRVKRRLLLVIAGLSPGVVTVALQEFAVSLAFMVLGVFGAICFATVTIAVLPQVGQTQEKHRINKKTHATLLISSAAKSLRDTAPEPTVIRGTLQGLISPVQSVPGFLTADEQVAMVLSHIIARWDETDVSQLTDDQLRELWLIERLMRSSPAEAGALSQYFASPEAMLAMRDAVSEPVTA